MVVMVVVVVETILVFSFRSRFWWVGDGWTKTKLMLFSTQVEVVLEDGVELGNKQQTNNLETIFYTVCLMTQDSFAKR